ncbi:ATP synthase subunit I [Bacillus ectoiniformans]|uniref:ATP synthase subunit I n=1 Tax=Bacillus ectoiniformans TaxID=1494429 RepID=UPI001959559D|nr:ATP synthase subunit I [Bacillus ectoiniformans]
MPELQHTFARHRKYILYLLSMFVLGWGITPYQPVFAGLIIGTSISFFNHWLMVKRMDRFGKAVESGQKVPSLGTFSRMASAALAAMIALSFPEQIHLVSTVLGLMASYFVIMIDFIVKNLIKSNNGEER